MTRSSGNCLQGFEAFKSTLKINQECTEGGVTNLVVHAFFVLMLDNLPVNLLNLIYIYGIFSVKLKCNFNLSKILFSPLIEGLIFQLPLQLSSIAWLVLNSSLKFEYEFYD